MEGEVIVRSCDRHSNETDTLKKHVTKYKNLRKWIVGFLRKFENRGIKIARVNPILITKYMNLQLYSLILYNAGARCDVDICKLIASTQSINIEVSGTIYGINAKKQHNFAIYA